MRGGFAASSDSDGHQAAGTQLFTKHEALEVDDLDLAAQALRNLGRVVVHGPVSYTHLQTSR